MVMFLVSLHHRTPILSIEILFPVHAVIAVYQPISTTFAISSATIVVDAGDLKNDDKVRLSDLQFPPGVRPSKNVKKDFVASVVQSSSLL